VRAFLYTGTSVAKSASSLGRLTFAEEEGAYQRRLGAAAAGLPVYAAPSESDLFGGSLSIFASKFEGFPAPFGKAPLPAERGVVAGEAAAEPATNDSYWFKSVGPLGEHPVRVVVLDTSTAPLSTEKECWLATQLGAANVEGVPAIVVGNREVGAEAELSHILVTGETSLCAVPFPAGAASAYFYGGNADRQGTISYGGASIPTYGSGTLGYVPIANPSAQEHAPASGFLLASIGEPNRAPGGKNIAPVTVSLIPNINSLAIDALDGTLLRRSQPALFEALARRPSAGYRCGGSQFAPRSCASVSPDPYVHIPDRCIRGFQSASCASEMLPEYRFTSSAPDIADFVAVDPASTNPKAVYLQNGKPVPDPRSGLMCAFNAGTTIVTVETGALSYSIPVTVQQGSVARPCGTVPLRNPPAVPAKPTVPPPPPPPGSTPHFTQPSGTVPPPHVPVVQTTPAPVTTPTPASAVPPVHHPIHPPVPAQFQFLPAPIPGITPVPVIVPPPPAPALEPTPPSGTSPVTQPAVSPEPEEEEEAAFDLVHHMVGYRHARARNVPEVFSSSSGAAPSARYFIPALALLIALAGAGIAAPGRRAPRLAYEPRATPRRSQR
jgi:hypothetical protein